MHNSINRFTQTVQDYIKYRPSYPKEVLETLITDCGLNKNCVVADIGSGTGLLTKLLVNNCKTVYAVEPNKDMRAAGEEYLKNYKNFISIDGTAEDTTLKSNSIDIITAATAFHWFEPKKTKLEFKRILKSNGFLVLIWNKRDIQHSKLIRDYEKLILKYGKDYCNSPANTFDKTPHDNFFNKDTLKIKSFKNLQKFDWEGFKGRLLSTSYSLRPNDKDYDSMIKELRDIFDNYQQNGFIEFIYATKLFYGLLG